MKYKLEDICIKITDGSHYSPIDDPTSSIPMLSVKDMEEFDFNYNNCKHISEEEYKKMLKNNCVPKLYDVLVAKDGSYLKEIFVNEKENKKAILSSIAIFRPNQDIVDPYFLCYLLKTPMILNYVKDNCVSGSALPRIILRAFKGIELMIPEIKTQKRIVKIIKDINDKIKVNNEINNNLHELCNNMYFELLSQLNEKNSTKKQMKEISKCVLGGTPSRVKSEYWNGNINWINSGEVNKFRIIEASETITDLGLQKSSTTLLPKGTTVLAITGATLGQVSRLEIDSCANQSVIGVIPSDKELNNYIYLSILNTINDLILKQTGGAQQHINKNDVETHEIIVPNDKLLKEFDDRIKSIFNKISLNCFENKRLEQLRDILLPKLMNGEINLDNIEI